MDYQKLFKGKVDRRRLLGNLGMMGAGAVITACGAGVATPQQPVSRRRHRRPTLTRPSSTSH